ncbi:hypothetical protein B0H17DRAFT_1201889 [Mycena rosella]|uniref:Uncharacterized protein n=1 Tax=Mycena rosella TaxID=1033263 RepID=A0AAD7GGR4_MYCRO|nr:hypothetical protein B0H17DRAFT_1201889 [Mycena rosella]
MNLTPYYCVPLFHNDPDLPAHSTQVFYLVTSPQAKAPRPGVYPSWSSAQRVAEGVPHGGGVRFYSYDVCLPGWHAGCDAGEHDHPTNPEKSSWTPTTPAAVQSPAPSTPTALATPLSPAPALHTPTPPPAAPPSDPFEARLEAVHALHYTVRGSSVVHSALNPALAEYSNLYSSTGDATLFTTDARHAAHVTFLIDKPSSSTTTTNPTISTTRNTKPKNPQAAKDGEDSPSTKSAQSAPASPDGLWRSLRNKSVDGPPQSHLHHQSDVAHQHSSRAKSAETSSQSRPRRKSDVASGVTSPSKLQDNLEGEGTLAPNLSNTIKRGPPQGAKKCVFPRMIPMAPQPDPSTRLPLNNEDDKEKGQEDDDDDKDDSDSPSVERDRKNEEEKDDDDEAPPIEVLPNPLPSPPPENDDPELDHNTPSPI